MEVIRLRMNIHQTVVKLLADYKKDRRISWLSAQCGIPQPTLSAAASGRPMSLKNIERLFEFCGVTLTEPGVSPEEYCRVPKVAAKAGAGSSLITSGEIEGYFAFRSDFLARQRISPDKSFLLEVMGYSMAPLIDNGDVVLVDESDTVVQEGKIYLVSFSEELLIKRIQCFLMQFLCATNLAPYFFFFGKK